MLERTRALYADLAHALGIDALAPDDNGGIELTVGTDQRVILYGERDRDLLLVAPLAALPREPDYGVMLWLLRKNFYVDGLAPFTLACDEGGTVIMWGRLPLDGLTGEALTGVSLAGLLDAVATEGEKIRAELDPPEG